MNKKLTYSLLGLVVVAVILALLFMPQRATTPGTENTGTSNSSNADSQNETSSQAEGDGKSIEIADFAFSPATLTVKVGDTVTWTNKDSVAHTVTAGESSDAAPDSPDIAQNESYSFTFTKAGTYDYFCKPHPEMQATIIVTE